MPYSIEAVRRFRARHQHAARYAAVCRLYASLRLALPAQWANINRFEEWAEYVKLNRHDRMGAAYGDVPTPTNYRITTPAGYAARARKPNKDIVQYEK